MASLLKQAKRGLRRRSEAFMHSAVSSARGSQSRFAPALCYAEMLLVDYGIVRTVYNNRHRVTDDAWRSAQPAPHHIAQAARRGVKTVVNLRGEEQTYGTRWLEERACARNGIKLVNLRLRSRAAPTRAELQAIKTLLEQIEFPILVHCKSGADRAGLMSVMIAHLHGGQPISEAIQQLSFRYGHVRSADTGVIDAVFERYLEAEKKTGIAFWDWVQNVYDAREVNSTFKARGWANRLVNGILRRE